MVTYKPTTNPSPLYRLRRRIRANESRHRVEDEVTVGLVAEPHRITVLGHRPRKTLETPQRCGVQVHLLLAKKKISEHANAHMYRPRVCGRQRRVGARAFVSFEKHMSRLFDFHEVLNVPTTSFGPFSPIPHV